MKRLFLLIGMVIFLASCNDDVTIVEEENNGRTLDLSVYYALKENQDKKMPDAGSRVFVYFGDYQDFYFDNEDGVVTKRDSVVLPDIKTFINEDGKIDILLELTDKPFTVIVESKWFKISMFYTYPPGKDNCILEMIFIY